MNFRITAKKGIGSFMYSFFAFMNRMKYIERWSLMHNTRKENIAEHSLQVAMLAHCLSVVNNEIFGGSLNAEKLCAYAVYHDISEVLTGDLPTPIKYSNPELKTAFKDLEKVASAKLLNYLPTRLQGRFKDVVEPMLSADEQKCLRAADKLSALIKCIDELKSGNSEFSKARQSIESEIAALKSKEADYFIETFISAYELTLDELDLSIK